MQIFPPTVVQTGNDIEKSDSKIITKGYFFIKLDSTKISKYIIHVYHRRQWLFPQELVE